MKLCKDCRYMAPAFEDGYEECLCPQQIVRIDLVSGNHTTRWPFCEIHRADNFFMSRILGTCGRSGRWFAPKEAA